MPVILWSSGLLFGILIVLVRLPLNAPPFDQLTMYTAIRCRCCPVWQ